MNSLPSMAIKHGSAEPLLTIPVNGLFILGVYQGSLSEFDMLLKYRQKQPDGSWSRIRTPKHIHWAVDMLIKIHEDTVTTNLFLDFLINYWDNSVKPLRTEEERNALLNLSTLSEFVAKESNRYASLTNKGEYSIKFLLLIAILLMHQEKTNREDAFMFRDVLASLRAGKDIFSVVSTATFTGR